MSIEHVTNTLRATADLVAEDPKGKKYPNLVSALRQLVSEIGKRPENAEGSIQGQDLNRAYCYACRILDRIDGKEESIFG